MPAHAGQANEIDFFAIRLQGGFPEPDTKFFKHAFFDEIFPKRFGIAYPEIDHQVFSKYLVVVVPQVDFAVVSLKAHIISDISFDAEARFLKKLFGTGKIALRWNAWRKRQTFRYKRF